MCFPEAGGELGATERCVSFALIDTLLHFEHGVAAMPPAGLNPSSGSAWLLSLFEKLADPTSLLSRALCELLGGLPPTQDAVGLAERVNALNVYESMTALLLHVVNEASRGSIAAWHGLFSSGVLHHLSASPFLDLQPTYLDAVDAGADASSLPGHEVHAPDAFTAGLPRGVRLDGELWLGRGKFSETMSVVRRQDRSVDAWTPVVYTVFDAPSAQTKKA